MKKKLNEVIYTVARYTEIAISFLLLAVIIVLIFPLLYSFIQMPILSVRPEQFTEFLGDLFTLLIGVEFVKMLAKHTAQTLLEVLMFAIARQMIVEHLDMLETIVGVAAIGIIFAIRKYLLLQVQENAPQMQDDKL